MLTTVFTNVIMIALGTDEAFSQSNRLAVDASNLTFLSVYFMEFLLKVYAHPRGYWRNGFNRFDFIILLFSIFQVLQYALSSLSFFSNFTITRVLRGTYFATLH